MQLNTDHTTVIWKIRNKVDEKQTKIFFKISGDWSNHSGALRTKYPTLTSEDVKLETGKERELFKRVETRLGKTEI